MNSTTRYIEIDSQYRDRNSWPLPGAFQIPISQSGTKDRFSALDPVSASAILLHQPVSFVNTPGGNFTLQGAVSVNPGPSVTQTSDPSQIVVKTYYTSNPVQEEDNFYAGSVIEAGISTLFNGSIWVAVGAGPTNAIVYSYDGFTWTGSSSGNSLFTNSYTVAYNGTKWVAVGTGTESIAYSYDGINWYAATSSTSIFTSGFDVTWYGTKWVAVGTGTYSIAYSTDGITWTGVTNSLTSIFNTGQGIACNGTRWIAVGGPGPSVVGGLNSIAYSLDGINWYGVSLYSNTLFSTGIAVAYNKSLWVAVGSGTTTIAYSIDGMSWKPVIGNPVIIGNGVVWNGANWVIVGQSGVNPIIYSYNGIDWVAAPSSAAIFSSCEDVAWNGTYWIVVGQNAGVGKIAYSSDSINWIEITTSAFSTVGYGITSNAMSTITLNPVQRRRITSSKYLYNDGTFEYTLFSLQNSFSDSVVDGVGFAISNPSIQLNAQYPLLYIPTGENANNFYVNCVVQKVPNSLDPALVETRNIVGYNGPAKFGYDGLTRLAQLDQYFTSALLPTDSIIVRKKVASESNTLTISGTSTSVFRLPSSASSEDNFYVGSFIRFAGSLSQIPYTVPPTTTTINGNEVRKIVSYDSVSKTVTVNPGFTTTPPIGAVYEILPFTIDNANPFVYTGSMVSQQEMVCYDVRLLNVVLPNRILSVGKGSLITFYPYVYVQLSNVSASGAGGKNMIYSNNPNSTRVLFRAPISDVPNLTSSTFIKIDGDGMSQIIKFKPNDNLYFAVTLPSGEIFETVLPEFSSPRSPNQLNQISAIFSIQRM